MKSLIFIRATLGAAIVALLLACGPLPLATDAVAAGAHTQGDDPANTPKEQEPTPEEKMARRFPQPVRVGDLIGLPVLDWQDSTIGYVRDVVRTPAGKIQLVVPYGAWFGWVNFNGAFDRARRPVAVPIETVAILARQIDVLDMPRAAFDSAPTFSAAQAVPLGRDEIIKIAITRR
jgi:hypothetical protein